MTGGHRSTPHWLRGTGGLWLLGVTLVSLVVTTLASGVIPTALGAVNGPVSAASTNSSDPKLSSPGPSYQSTMVEDPAEGYDLLFGGSVGHVTVHGVKYGDTWTYKSGLWTDITPSDCTNANCPRLQSYPQMAYYNATGQRFVVMLEEAPGPARQWYYGNTWIFNGSWHNVTPKPLIPFVNSPPFYRTGSMTWDPSSGYGILFGGCATANCCLANCTSPLSYETWGFHGVVNGVGQWTNLTTAVHPPGMRNPGLTFDAADSYVVLFGGAIQGPPPYGLTIENQTWTFTMADGWVNRTAATFNATNTPPGVTLIDGQLAYDSAIGSVVLFGGMHFWGTPTSGDKTPNATLNVTWTYRAGNWTNITGSLAHSPPPRFAAVMAFDASDNVVVLFGGLAGTQVNAGFLGDTWWLGGDPLQWTNHTAGYSVTFSESGLPSNESWSVQVSGVRQSSTGKISFVEPNGTFGYLIGSVSGFYLAKGSSSGSVTVDGVNPPTIVVQWARNVTYPIKFSESGLPKGTTWNVTIDGKEKSVSADSVTFHLPNGTYDFAIFASGYTEKSVPPSPLTVNGSTLSVKVTFT